MRRYFGWTLAVAALLVYLFGSQIITLLTDLLWFSEVGYRPVMQTALRTQALLAAVLGILFFAIVYSNLWIARRWAPPVPRLYQEIGLGERIGEFARRTIDLLLLGGSLIAALFAALEATGHWQQYLLWANPTSFGVRDPLFNRDVSFYVFRLPFILYLYRWLLAALIVAFLATAWVHYSDRALQFVANVPVPRFAPHVKVHLSILLALMLFVLSFGYWMRQYGLLQSDFGNLGLNGAGYTDVHARLTGLKLMSIGSALVGVLLLVNLRLRGLTVPAYGMGALIGLSILVGVAYPALLQSYRVKPNEPVLERPFIQNNITFTRRAYQLDRVEVSPYEADRPLTATSLEQHRPTIENIRLWDYKMLPRVFNQQQALKPYYTFGQDDGAGVNVDVDVDRYRFATGYQQVMLAARELDLGQVPQKTWVAQRLQYTHGYGVVMVPVDSVTPEGSPQYLIKDMPPRPIPALEKRLAIKRPQIYYGMADNGYSIVNTQQPEFDFPSGNEDKFTDYAGKGGIPIPSYGRKLLFALRFGEANFVLSGLIGPRARVLMHRQVQQRIGRVAPFLEQDSDPYLVVADGRLTWIVDCYTTTDMYPYSQPTAGRASFNYIRNAVKATVDAYDGAMNFYVFDPSDPLIRSYGRIFSTLFKPAEQFPASLRPHIRYPEDLFNIQSRQYRIYHMTDPAAFYTQSDAWALATEGASRAENPPAMEPYFVTMRLPGAKAEEFILIRPFTPVRRNNMAAWMAVRCDPENYGKILVYEFPKTTLTQGPAQIESRIQQDPVISQRVSLWDARGSRVHWGNLLVFPIGRSMLYVQPLYLEAQQGTARMPELKQVIVATDQPQRVVMEPTLEAALNRVVSGRVATPEIPETAGTAPTTPTGAEPPPARTPTGTTAQLARRANQQFQRAEAAQRAGDWAAYGAALRELRQTLQALEGQAGGPAGE